VDAIKGSISLPAKSIQALVSNINPLSTPNCKPALSVWQTLISSLNWFLNVLPWTCLGLAKMYGKTSGKTHYR
ncbi:hypothetical protein K435DRAFT_670715, partial [Dendrothele bispora CBS 962.96]